jgi:hypothetical protein
MSEEICARKEAYRPYRIIPCEEGFAICDGFYQRGGHKTLYIYAILPDAQAVGEWLTRKGTRTNPTEQPSFISYYKEAPKNPPSNLELDFDLGL